MLNEHSFWKPLKFVFTEVGSGRNDGGSKENTSNKSKERDSVLYPVQESQKTKHNATPSVAR